MKPRPLFGPAIFLSAFLLFQVQPLIAKQILPWFGGTASVWTVSLLFFQVVLVAGYLWADWLSLQSSKRQTNLQLLLLAVSLASLPIAPSAVWKLHGTEDPVPRILGLLAYAVGLPCLVLASASPLLQLWFSRAETGSSWRYFALSNAGAMTGLIAYPFVVEPWLTNSQQAWGWSGLYAVAVVLIGVVAWSVRSAPVPEVVPTAGNFNRLLCLLLAAVPSALLLAVTNHLSDNIAAVPFVWVLPLVLYLLSFILCFSSERWYRRWLWLPLAAVVLPAMAFAIVQNPQLAKAGADDLRNVLFVLPGGAFVVFMLCHGELAARRPATGALTSFYLILAAGGALGGALVAVVAPAVTNDLYELPALICISTLLVVWILWSATRGGPKWYFAIPAMAAGLAFGFCFFVAGFSWRSGSFARVRVRNHYGVLTVYDDRSAGDLGSIRILRHGAIEHGEQFLAEENQKLPTSYYSHNSGVGLALDALMPKGSLTVGIVGLGAGTLFTYSRPQDRYFAYELNPMMLNLASSQFTFMAETESVRDIRLGDARQSLESQLPRNFDLLALDAFSGNAIPIHLLTREAFALYWKHLKPDGVLAVHVSSKHLALAPIVDLAARADGKQARLVTFAGAPRTAESASEWVLVTAKSDLFDLAGIREHVQPIIPISGLRLWTDSYSSLAAILR